MVRSTRLLVGSSLALALGLSTFVGAAGAQEENAQATTTRALIKQLPASTIFAFNVNDMDRTKKWMAESSFALLVQDPEVKPLYDQAVGFLKGMAAMAKEQTGVDFWEMVQQIKGEVGLALTGVQITRRGPAPRLMIMIDCKDARAGFQADIDKLLALIPDGRVKTADRDVAGVKIRSFQMVVPEGDGSRRMRGPARVAQMIGNIHMGWLGTTLVISNDKSGFEKLVQVRAGEDLKTLGDTQNWKDTMQFLGGTGDSTVFMNINAISELLEMALPMMPEEVGPVISALGIDEFPALGASTFYTQNGARSKMIVRYSGDGKSGLGSMLAFKDSKLEIPRWIPEDAMQVFMFDYDFEKAFSGLLGMAQEMGEEPYEELMGGLEEFKQEFGLSIQDDIIPALAGPVIIVQNEPISSETIDDLTSRGAMRFNPMMGGGTSMFGIKIRNRAPIAQMLEFMEGMGAEVTDYAGAKIYAPPRVDDDMPATDVAITDNYVLASIGTTSMVRPILQRMGGREPGLGAVQGVRDALESLPREGFGLWVVNYGKNIASTLNMVKLLSNLFDAPEQLAKMRIPSASIFEKYFGYSGGVLSFKPGQGVLIDSNFLMKRP